MVFVIQTQVHATAIKVGKEQAVMKLLFVKINQKEWTIVAITVVVQTINVHVKLDLPDLNANTKITVMTLNVKMVEPVTQKLDNVIVLLNSSELFAISKTYAIKLIALKN